MSNAQETGIWRQRGGRVAALVVTLCLSMVVVPTASQGSAAATPESELEAFTGALVGGKPWLYTRYRFEHVEQDGLARDADANTLMTRVGYRTGEYRGFSALFEAENISHLGNDDFNDTLNAKTTYPVVADPESTAINQLYLDFAGIPETRLRFGRQRFVLDNQRFIGSLDFRQNQQTFDAVTVTNESLADTRLTYGYLFQVLRIFGEDSGAGSYNTASHILNASYAGLGFATLTAYGYLLDIDDVPARSTRTFGLRAGGAYEVAQGLDLLYTAEGARQFDHGNNPSDYDIGYYLLEGGLRYRGLTAKASYEVLQGNGSQAFQTPLATAHKFQGWADKFLTTPAGGIEDLSFSLAYEIRGLGRLDGLRLMGVYHDFSAENGGGDYGGDYGGEFDFIVSKTLFEHFTLVLKYANYQADGFATDTEKLWLSVGAKF